MRTNCQFSGGGCQSGAPSGRRGSTSGVEQHLKGVQAFILSPCSSEPLASTIPPSLSWGIFQTTINTLSSVAWPWGVEEEEGGGGGGGGGGGRWRTAEEIGQEEINEVREDGMVGRKSWLSGSYRKIVCWVVKGMRRWRWWEKCLKDHDRVCEVAQTKYYVSLLLRCVASLHLAGRHKKKKRRQEINDSWPKTYILPSHTRRQCHPPRASQEEHLLLCMCIITAFECNTSTYSLCGPVTIILFNERILIGLTSRFLLWHLLESSMLPLFHRFHLNVWDF